MMDNKVQLSFVALDPMGVRNYPVYKEIESRKDYVIQGDWDDYPNFLYDCYENCPQLQTIINTCTDFVCGNEITSTAQGFEAIVNRKGETVKELLGHLANDYWIFGGFYLQVIRDSRGNIAELYWLDYRYVRTDKHNEAFWYSEDFGKKYGRTSKALMYPRFMKDSMEPSSILMVKSKASRGVYAGSPWKSAMRSVLTAIEISKFHMNEILNNFTASAVINFNNGIPTDEQKKEIEKNIVEKFTGSDNAGRFVLSFNNTRDNQTTIQRLGEDSFDERYQALEKNVQQQIFTCFGLNPNLVGINTENNGFAQENFDDAFKLFNRTRINPVQQLLVEVWEKLFGQGTLNISSFGLNDNNVVDDVVD